MSWISEYEKLNFIEELFLKTTLKIFLIETFEHEL